MTRLALRRGTVVSVDEEGAAARVTVEVGGEHRPAIAYVDLTGPVEPGDEVVVNVAALELGLGSGGFDVVHANLTRGLDGVADPAAHIMKLNYTSLQHGIDPLPAGPAGGVPGKPVAVLALHAQLSCVAWAAAQAAPDARIGYIQTWGGALPGPLSRTVRELRERSLLVGHITSGSAFGGEYESMNTEAAIAAAFTTLEWDAAIVGPGPGIVGSGTFLGHGGLAALESAHAALALRCRTILVPRMSSADPRPRHKRISHHTIAVLHMLLRPVILALPDDWQDTLPGGHTPIGAFADLDGYRGSGLPAETMGRGIDEDELFFRAALAGGAVLGSELRGIRADRD